MSFLPARDEPPGWLVLNAVEEAIVKTGRVCEAAGGGYFLANGGAVSFESRLERRDNPVLELATPECSDPWELVRYIRAQEPFLACVAEHSERVLKRHGFPGRTIFGRSNTDWGGQPLGSHENYWVRWRDPWPLALLCVVVAVLVSWAISLLNGFFFIVAHLAVRLGTLLRRRLRQTAPGRRLLALAEQARGLWASAGLPRAAFLWQRSGRALLRLLLGVVEPVVDRLFLGRLRTELVPFLATRQVFSGGGNLVYQSGGTPLHLSARAGYLRRSAGLSFGQRSKAVFDVKPLLRDPLSALRGRLRLCIAGGDSLMADTAILLTAGTTSLVLTMLEAGERFEEVHLPSPLEAWRRVSAGGALTRLRVRNGEELNALGVQQAYLQRAKRFFAASPPGSLPDQIIRLWEGVLSCLSENPASLWGQVDWVTKKVLLDRIVFPGGDWKDLRRWGELFTDLKRSMPQTGWLSQLTCATAQAHLGPWRRRVHAPLLACEELFGQGRALFLSAAKLQVRYHEVSRRGGYFQQLRAAGEVPSLVGDEEAAAAQREPPARTRAAIRGRAIALARDPWDLEASWDTIRVNSLNLSVTIRDPLVHL